MIRSLRGLFFILPLCLFIFHVSPVRSETITVFAAASLKDSLDVVGQLYAKENGTEIKYSFASSAVLAKQIENGAPADVFISADLKWMDYLASKRLIRNETRRNLLGNSLVVIAPRSSSLNDIHFTQDEFAKILSESRIATGDVNSVPAGLYAKAAFEKFGLWPLVEPKLAQRMSARHLLSYRVGKLN
jgi:molybdate transport system substrate-binding protein